MTDLSKFTALTAKEMLAEISRIERASARVLAQLRAIQRAAAAIEADDQDADGSEG